MWKAANQDSRLAEVKPAEMAQGHQKDYYVLLREVMQLSPSALPL